MDSDDAEKELRAQVAQWENLPKVLTARLNEKPPAMWRESMGIHHMVTGVKQRSGLSGLEAANRLAWKWINDEDASRFGIDEPRLIPREKVPYFEAALEAVFEGALMGSFESAGTWARHVYAPQLPAAEDYIDWERMGEDILDGPQLLVARHPGSLLAIWVFDNRLARATLNRWLRGAGQKEQ